MTTPYLAPSLVVLRDEINALYPRRDKASDGWLGDAAHQARPSSHNPNAEGVVRALDTDIDDNDPGHDLRAEILRAAIGDPRVWYVISNGVIYSRTHGFEPRAYTGPNGHFHHVHVSLIEERWAWLDTSPWINREDDDMPNYRDWPEEDRRALAKDVAEAVKQVLIAPNVSLGGAVRYIFAKMGGTVKRS